MIIPEKNLAFIHIPKCGGSSVENLFLKELGVLNGKSHWNQLPPASIQKYWLGGSSLQHLSVDKLKGRLRGCKVFTITRDPVQRAISEFYYQAKELQKRGIKIGPYVRGNVSDAILKGRFKRFAYPYHTNSQKSFIQQRVPDMEEVEMIKLEEINQHFGEFTKNHFGKELILPHNNGSVRHGETQLSEAAFHTIMDEWGGDYDYCGYEKPEMLVNRVPRIIWMYWDKGVKHLPRVVKASINSWKKANPHWEIRLLDEGSPEVREAATIWEGRNISVQAQSDIIRLHLLKNHGGVWADATTMCTKPLSSWVDGQVGTNGLFVFRNDPVASWFIAAKKDSLALEVWYQSMLEYWSGRREADDYFWVHKLFHKVEDRGLVKDMGWIDAWTDEHGGLGPHQMVPYGDGDIQSVGFLDIQQLMKEDAPVLKMAHGIRPMPNSRNDAIIRIFT